MRSPKPVTPACHEPAAFPCESCAPPSPLITFLRSTSGRVSAIFNLPQLARSEIRDDLSRSFEGDQYLGFTLVDAADVLIVPHHVLCGFSMKELLPGHEESPVQSGLGDGSLRQWQSPAYAPSCEGQENWFSRWPSVAG